MKKRKICVVTGTHAEYGLLRWLMDGINQSSKLELQIIATGMHLSPEFGLTYKEIENDGATVEIIIDHQKLSFEENLKTSPIHGKSVIVNLHKYINIRNCS